MSVSFRYVSTPEGVKTELCNQSEFIKALGAVRTKTVSAALATGGCVTITLLTLAAIVRGDHGATEIVLMAIAAGVSAVMANTF